MMAGGPAAGEPEAAGGPAGEEQENHEQRAPRTAPEMSLREALGLVEAFHERFGLFLARRPTVEVPPDVLATRLRLFEEELAEYREAAHARDMVAVADALADLLYVLFGTFVTHGLGDAAADLLAEVHRSNMSKLDAEGRPVIRDGKVRKSELFSEPELTPIIARYQGDHSWRK